MVDEDNNNINRNAIQKQNEILTQIMLETIPKIYEPCETGYINFFSLEMSSFESGEAQKELVLVLLNIISGPGPVPILSSYLGSS